MVVGSLSRSISLIGVAVVISLVTLTAVGEAAAYKQGAHGQCGPPDAPTVVGTRQARVFSVAGSDPPSTERLRACLNSSGRSWSLPSTVRAPNSTVLDEASLKLDAPWLAYSERITGIDGGEVDLAVKDLRNGATKMCQIGGFNLPGRAPSLIRIVISSDGVAGWSGWARAPETAGSAALEKVIGLCEVSGGQVLDHGAGIQLGSIAWKGLVLSWTDKGQAKSFAAAGSG